MEAWFAWTVLIAEAEALVLTADRRIIRIIRKTAVARVADLGATGLNRFLIRYLPLSETWPPNLLMAHPDNCEGN